jgi:hypothetical protein
VWHSSHSVLLCARADSPLGTSPNSSVDSFSQQDGKDTPCMLLGHWTSTDAAPASPIGLTARTAAPRLAPRRTRTTRYSPARSRPSPQYAASSLHRRRAQAPAHSTAGRRCTQRTTKVQRRQLRHPSETRCQRCCPGCSDPIDCTHRRSSARPSPTPNHPLQPRAQLPQPTTRISILAQPAFASTREQHKPSRWHAAYRRRPASSDAPSFRDSVPATLPQLL